MFLSSDGGWNMFPLLDAVGLHFEFERLAKCLSKKPYTLWDNFKTQMSPAGHYDAFRLTS